MGPAEIAKKTGGKAMNALRMMTTAVLAAAFIAPGIAAADYGMKARTQVNVRSGPGTGYGVIGTVPTGQDYVAFARTGNWYRIYYAGNAGWTLGDYWSGLPTTSTGVRVNTSVLNVRSGPSTGSSIRGRAYMGQVYFWTLHLSGWYKIFWGGGVGYVADGFVSVVRLPGIGSSPPAPAPAPPPSTASRIILNVPIIRQMPELPTGCEITSVTMMLQYRGARVSKTQLANEMPRSSNPDYGFVGNPYSSSGWTIYPPALMNLVRKYAGSAVNLAGGGIATLQNQIRRNRPVVVWVTMHGFTIHALTVTGFDSTGIFYNDCWTGQKNARLSNSAFYSTWSTHARRAISY